MTKTLQELWMLSSVTLNCQATKIVMDSVCQLSELKSVSQMSQVSRIVFAIVKLVKIVKMVEKFRNKIHICQKLSKGNSYQPSSIRLFWLLSKNYIFVGKLDLQKQYVWLDLTLGNFTLTTSNLHNIYIYLHNLLASVLPSFFLPNLELTRFRYEPT